MKKKIDTKKPMTIKHSAQYYLDIMENLHRGLYSLTGHKLVQRQQKYEPIYIDQTQNHRTKFAKELTPNEVAILENDLDVLSEAISSMLDILNQEGRTQQSE